MKKLHIDADRITYSVGFACETKQPDGTFTCDEPIANVLHSVKLSLQSLVDAFADAVNGEEFGVVVHLTGKGNFREKIYPEYKQNRADSRKPIHADAIREYMIKQWDAVVSEGMEADDAIGIAMHSDKEAVCCSGDKDLLNCPGFHFHPKTLKLEVIDEQFAHWHFYKQLLTGDKVDNIPGVRWVPEEYFARHRLNRTRSISPEKKDKDKRTVGETTAKGFLKDCETEEEMFLRCLELYTARELAEAPDSPGLAEQGALEDMLLNGRLLWMTQKLHEDGSPVLWMEGL